MPMQAQPEGTSRVRLDAPVENPETGKPFPARAFGIDYTDPDFGKVRIGETRRVTEGKRRGDWEPVSVVPASALPDDATLLEPVSRHNDAMEYLRDVWRLARGNGWVPPDVPKPAQGAAEQPPAEVPPASPPPAATPPESLDSLPEMPGVPVVPVPPGTDAGQFVLPAAKKERATSREAGEVTRQIPAGHPDDPSAQNGMLTAAAAAVIPPADPVVQQAIVDADDWLNQPARPSEPAFLDGDFPLDFPGPPH